MTAIHRSESRLLTIATILAFTAAIEASELYIGAATTSITPDQPVALSGQRHTRIATEVESPVVATALVITPPRATWVSGSRLRTRRIVASTKVPSAATATPSLR